MHSLLRPAQRALEDAQRALEQEAEGALAIAVLRLRVEADKLAELVATW